MTRRGSFGPIVLLGLGSAALAAVAGNKPWIEVGPPGGECEIHVAPGVSFSTIEQGAPLAGALGLVLLAAWGVLLVTRARTRRVVGVLAVLAAAGFLATAAAARSFLKEAAREEGRERIGTMPEGCGFVTVHMNNSWWLVALAAGLLAVVASVLAVVLCRSWPEMGSKYDAPSAGTPATAVPLEQQSSADLWKSLDAGHDPTVHSGSDPEADDRPSA